MQNRNILYLDDEVHNLQVFKVSFIDDFNVFIASNRLEALEIFKNEDIQVMITDQRMPDVDGTDFINEVGELYPTVISILLTAYTEVELLITAINTSKVFRFLQKPWNYDELKHTISTAIETFYLKEEKRLLIEELTQAKLHAEESDRLKSRFLANISHEIRTPLNGIIGFSSMIMSSSKSENGKVKEFEKVLFDSCDRLIEVVEDLVLASQIEAGTVRINNRELSLCTLMDNIRLKYLPKAEAKGIELNVVDSCVDDKFIINTDKAKLHEILSQLILNAIKFTDKGTVEFGLESIDGRDVFFVKDTGIGMDKEKQKHIFGFFNQGEETIYTRDFDGNGLGLSIAKGLVDLLSGEMWFDTKEGEGSSFYFYIPFERVTCTD